jgi:phosphomannomutase
MTIAFGTEGWRGVIAEEFTADNVRLVTQAIADHLRAQATVPAGAGGARAGVSVRPLGVAVGYDTRFLSDYFARAVCEVLAANGIASRLSRAAVPTCAVSRYVVHAGLSLGIMVTASHNPAVYNGLKVKEAFGGSSSQETVTSIEQRLGASPIRRQPFEEALAARAVQQADLIAPFLRGLRAAVDLAAIRGTRLRILVDSMHGAGGRLIERLLKGGRARVETLRAEPDPLFGGAAPEPIPARLGELMRAVRRSRADVGIANDGDADRISAVAPGGRWLNPGQLLCLLLAHLVATRQATGAVVKTISNTMMINRMATALGLRLIEVPVGFKHIAKLMLEDHVLIGGEESGGIGVAGYLPERDGILNGLLLLEAMAVRRKRLPDLVRELERRFGRWHYGRRDLRLTESQVDGLFARLGGQAPTDLAGIPVARVNPLDGVKLIGRDDSWLLFRRSGTEPVVRIYAETPDPRRLSRLLALGVRLAQAG